MMSFDVEVGVIDKLNPDTSVVEEAVKARSVVNCKCLFEQ